MPRSLLVSTLQTKILNTKLLLHAVELIHVCFQNEHFPQLRFLIFPSADQIVCKTRLDYLEKQRRSRPIVFFVDEEASKFWKTYICWLFRYFFHLPVIITKINWFIIWLFLSTLFGYLFLFYSLFCLLLDIYLYIYICAT